jgi:hypothetical protein
MGGLASVWRDHPDIGWTPDKTFRRVLTEVVDMSGFGGQVYNAEHAEAITRCEAETAYFIKTYCQIEDLRAKNWVPFALWPEQERVLREIEASSLRKTIILKARQLGLSWLMLAYALWRMRFRPIERVLIFSYREAEAKDLLKRLREMHKRLPTWLQLQTREGREFEDNKLTWDLSNGSSAKAFPTTGGRSYTASLVIADEADFAPDFGDLLKRVEPTVDASGQLLVLSTVDKDQPESDFKRVYRAATKHENDWHHVFLPWHARPDRSPDWYERQKADKLANTGALDDVYQEYPATPAEALMPRTLNKRIPPEWLNRCQAEATPITPPNAPAIPGLVIYKAPIPGRLYDIGADPAEGLAGGDDSAATVLDHVSGEEVASLAGKIAPDQFASAIDQVGRYFNHAAILVERNNHGHAVISGLRSSPLPLYFEPGREDEEGREGWATTAKSKAELYIVAAHAFREGQTTIHSDETMLQLASIDHATLNAPPGQHDDRAVSYVLALRAASLPRPIKFAGGWSKALAGGGAKGWGVKR